LILLPKNNSLLNSNIHSHTLSILVSPSLKIKAEKIIHSLSQTSPQQSPHQSLQTSPHQSSQQSLQTSPQQSPQTSSQLSLQTSSQLSSQQSLQLSSQNNSQITSGTLFQDKKEKKIESDNDNDNDNDNDSDNEIDNESDVDEECYEDSEDSDVSCIEVNTKNNETLLINSNKEIIKIDLDGFGYVAGKLLQSNKKDYDVFIQPDYFKIIYH